MVVFIYFLIVNFFFLKSFVLILICFCIRFFILTLLDVFVFGFLVLILIFEVVIRGFELWCKVFCFSVCYLLEVVF